MTEDARIINGEIIGEIVGDELIVSDGDTGFVTYKLGVTLSSGNAYVVRGPVRRPRGRPVTTDWQSAFRWLVAKVAKEGLPEKQERVTEWLLGWLENKGFETSRSQAAGYVHLIYEDYKKIR